MKKINKILVYIFLDNLLAILLITGTAGIIFWRLNADAKKDVVDNLTFPVGEILNHFDNVSTDWTALSNNLILYDYNLLVAKDNHMVFSNLENNQYRALEYFQKLELSQNTLIGQIDDIAFIVKPSQAYTFFALKNIAAAPKNNVFLTAYLIFCCITILIIILTRIIYTKKIIAQTRVPIKQLTTAAEAMAAENFTSPIAYSEKDDLTGIIKILNQMQKAVHVERTTSTAYEEAHTDIISGISQNLRMPLTTVKNHLKVLIDGSTGTPAQREQCLSAAYAMIGDMDALLQKLFLLVCLETGDMQMIFASLDLGVFLRNFFEDLRDEFKKQNIQLRLEITPAFHTVKADQLQLRRVLLNLIENSIKYAHAKPLQLHISLWIENDIEYLLFADNGQGIPERDLSHLFDRFWQGENAISSEGSGLGLCLVKYIVTAHGGSIKSQNRQGLQFMLSLPHNEEDFS